METSVRGTFHFHSVYSHDGKSTLPQIVARLQAQGFAFCIMTEHFEDFDEAKFNRYVQEIDTLNREGRFVLISGVEINLSGVDTIVFPARDYRECRQFAEKGCETGLRMFKVVAHPTKYPFETVARHLHTYQIDGIELWNQQADSSYMPPLSFLSALQCQPYCNDYRYLFGCDLHDVNLTVSNVISLASGERLDADAIVNRIREGGFDTSNLRTGVNYCNGPDRPDFQDWVRETSSRSYSNGKRLRMVRRMLRACYRILPCRAQHALNDIKNYVRNKV
jgi:hypothetical protein